MEMVSHEWSEYVSEKEWKRELTWVKKIREFASTWVDVVDALPAHEWGENGQRRPVSKVANKVGPFFSLYWK